MASGLWGVQQGWEEAHWLCVSCCSLESAGEEAWVDRAELHKDPIVYFI